MREITNDRFEALVKQVPVKPRFKRELKFRASTERMDPAQWVETELLPIWNRSGNGGMLLIEVDDILYMVPFEASKPSAGTSGRAKPVICDLCFTWQSGGGGGFVTFYPGKGSDDSVSLLCCMDLACSANVRTKTPASLKSRAQLREDLTNDDRAERLHGRLKNFAARLQLEEAN